MSNILTKLFSAGAVNFAEGVAGVVDKFVTTSDEKAQIKLQIQALAQQAATELETTVRTELATKEKIMVAELQSGDNYTRRARPTLAYFGMLVILVNYVVLPWVSAFTDGGYNALPPIEMPAEFWWAWGGVVATWSVGRSMERRGSKNELVKMISGKPKSLLD